MRLHKRIFSSTLLLASALLGGAASAADETYVVKSGDNLWDIAIAHHVTLAALEAVNKQIPDYNLIYPGQVINLPIAAPAPAPKKTSPPAPAPAPVPVALNFGGPEIELSTPQRGAQLPVGSCLVKGLAKDADGIELVTVDGVPATLDASGDFVSMVDLTVGANVISIHAVSKKGATSDASIGVLAGTFGTDVASAVETRVTNQALEVATVALAPLLATDLKALQGRRLASVSVTPTKGIEITTTVDLGALSVATPALSLQATKAGLVADVAVTNVNLAAPVTVDATIFGTKVQFIHTLDLHFDRFAAKGMLDLSKSSGTALVVDASPLTLDYSPTIASDVVGQAAVNEVNKFLAQVSAFFPGKPVLTFDEVAIVNKAIAVLFQDGLQSSIDNRVASMITLPGLKGIPLALGPTSATVDYTIDQVSIDASGLDLGLGLNVLLALPDVHASKGALLVGGGFPALDATSGLQVAVAQDMINRLLEEGWRKGLLDKTIDESIAKQIGLLLDAANLKSLVPALTSFIPANADLELSVAPGAPPIVQLSQGNKTTLELTEVMVSVSVVDGAKKTVLFATDVHATLPVTFGYAGGYLTLTLGQTAFTFDLQSSIVPLPKLAVESALDFIAPVVVDFAADHFLGPIPIPQTTILGVTPSLESLSTAGPKYDFLEADLSVK